MNPPEPNTARVALITGAAGGLGQGLIQAFADQGWRVAAGYHEARPAVSSPHVMALPLDVTQTNSIAAACDAIGQRWARIDALINNAGIAADGAIWQMEIAAWDRVVDVNLKGAFRCAQAALPLMLGQPSGHIINISSFSGRGGARGQANYAAAKAGLLGLTQSLARELGPRNIRVNAVLPGVLPTPMTTHLSDQQRTAFAEANVLRRWNSVAEVARFVAFLATLENVSGQLFQLDSRIARWT